MNSIDSILFLHQNSRVNLADDKKLPSNYVKPGNIIDLNQPQIQELQHDDYPLPILNSKDYLKRF